MPRIPVKVLVIDDEYEERKGDIERCSNDSQFCEYEFEYCDKYEKTEAKKLNDYDIILLDLGFPDGCKQGPDALIDIREQQKFAGFVVLFTKSLDRSNVDEYLTNGRANEYFWIGYGADVLINIMDRLMESRIITERVKIPTILRYYSDEDFETHIYHPYSTCASGHSKSVIEELGVKILSTEWSLAANNEIISKGVMGDVIKMIEKLSGSDIPVIILGDTGTGKELVAKLLHFHHKSKRKDCPFQALNCGGLPKDVLDVLLFGSLPGAFTGAREKAGIFEQVTKYVKKGGRSRNDVDKAAGGGGSVFLDEIGIMNMESQAFLLRVLQERVVNRLGYDLQKLPLGKIKVGTEDIPSYLFGDIAVDFRLISATNEDIIERIEKGNFRLDLYFRIAYETIKVPRLVERSFEDFNLLFQFFLKKYGEGKYPYIKESLTKDGINLNEEVFNLIHNLWINFPWRGNVRELEGVVHTMVAYFKEGDRFSIESIPPTFKECAKRLGKIQERRRVQ